jgi:hypothetical protein
VVSVSCKLLCFLTSFSPTYIFFFLFSSLSLSLLNASTGWKLTHQLANVMMVLYFIFVAESLLLEFNVLFPKAKSAC